MSCDRATMESSLDRNCQSVNLNVFFPHIGENPKFTIPNSNLCGHQGVFLTTEHQVRLDFLITRSQQHWQLRTWQGLDFWHKSLPYLVFNLSMWIAFHPLGVVFVLCALNTMGNPPDASDLGRNSCVSFRFLTRARKRHTGSKQLQMTKSKCINHFQESPIVSSEHCPPDLELVRLSGETFCHWLLWSPFVSELCRTFFEVQTPELPWKTFTTDFAKDCKGFGIYIHKNYFAWKRRDLENDSHMHGDGWQRNQDVEFAF